MTGGRVVRGLVAVSLTLLLTGCWLQPDFDGGRTRWNPWEERITPADVASLEQVWSVEIPTTRASMPDPLVYGDRVFLPTETLAPIPGRFSSSIGVRALDAATGDTVWEQAVNPPEVVGTPFHDLTFVEGELWVDYLSRSAEDCEAITVRLGREGIVIGEEESQAIGGVMQSGRYVVQTLRDGCGPLLTPQILSVRDSRTRETLWTAAAGNFSTSLLAGDLVVTAAGAFPLGGCGAPTCNPIWTHSDIGSPVAAPADTDVFFYRPPFGSDAPGDLEAISRDTGARQWSARFPGSRAGFALDDDHVYATPNTNRTPMLHAYDVDGCGTATCAPAWQGTVGTGESGLTPTVAGDVVYVPTRQGTIHAFAADGCGPSSTCAPIASIDSGLGDDISAMSVSGGRLFVVAYTAELTYTVTAFAPIAAS